MRVASFFVFSAALAAQPIAGYEARQFQSPTGKLLNYRLYSPPNYDPAKRYPLVIWLHDIVGVANDNKRQIGPSNFAATRLFVSPEVQQRYPAFILAPQCPAGNFWIHFLTRKPTQPLLLTVEVIDQLQRDLPIDPDRLYLAGQSLGSFATWALLATYPNKFAAAIPVSGAGLPSQAPKFAHVPLWAFHGRLDPLVPAYETRRMIRALRKAGGHPKYTELAAHFHGVSVWKVVFADPTLVDWLFAQHRN